MTWYLQVTQSKIFVLCSAHLTHSISPTTFKETAAVCTASGILIFILFQSAAVWFFMMTDHRDMHSVNLNGIDFP